MVFFGDIYCYEGDWSRASEYIQAASERARELDDLYLLLSVESGLALTSFKTGKLSQAQASLRRAFNLADMLGQASAYPYLYWLKGIGAAEMKDFDQAEQSLGEALGRFQALNNVNYSAAVGLELAIVLSLRGRRSEVLAVARAALPVLQELELNDECLVLVGVLEKGILERKVEKNLLWHLRSRLGAELGLVEFLKNPGGHRVAPQELQSSH